MSYPAPHKLEDDIWFGPAFKSDEVLFIEQQEEEQKLLELEYLPDLPSEPLEVVESEDIHQFMYELATKSATTLSLNPMPVLGGGSEGLHENWQSGTGLYK